MLTTMHPGDEINGRFRLIEPIGSGGVGTVWKAKQIGNGFAALKFLHENSPDSVRRFQVEAQALAQLNHPGCVRVIEHSHTSDGVPFVAMELVQGDPLTKFHESPLPLPTVIDVACQLCDALQHAHSRGVVHRDLKPDNIILSPRQKGSGGGFHVTLVDFGIAKFAAPGPEVTATGEILGTPGYMSPEQIRDSRTSEARSDQYSLGIILYELVSGTHPFQGTTSFEILAQQLRSEVQPLPPKICPPALATVIGRLVQTDPSGRYADLREVRRALSPAATANRRLRFAARQVALVAAGATVGIVAALALVQNEPPPVNEPPPTRRQLATGIVRPKLDDTQISDAAAPSVPPSYRCDAPSEEVFDLQIGERARQVWVKRPVGALDAPPPALVLLTYRRRSAKDFAKRSDLDSFLKSGFVLIGPEAIEDGFVPPEIGGLDTPPHVRPWRLPQDEDFVLAAVDKLAKRHCIDNKRIYAVGHAEGAELVRRLTCRDDLPFAAVTLSGSADRVDECRMKTTLPVLRIAGNRDKSVPRAGGVGCWGSEYRSADDTNHAFAKALQCAAEPLTWETEACRRFDCQAAPFVSCATPGGHYLQFANYANNDMRNLSKLLTPAGQSDPFDPKICGAVRKLDADFGLTYDQIVRRFINDLESGKLSSSP